MIISWDGVMDQKKPAQSACVASRNRLQRASPPLFFLSPFPTGPPLTSPQLNSTQLILKHLLSLSLFLFSSPPSFLVWNIVFALFYPSFRSC